MSILKCFERAASWRDWQVGTHGIIIDFTDPLTGHAKSATFLPEVAERQEWDHLETLKARTWIIPPKHAFSILHAHMNTQHPWTPNDHTNSI